MYLTSCHEEAMLPPNKEQTTSLRMLPRMENVERYNSRPRYATYLATREDMGIPPSPLLSLIKVPTLQYAEHGHALLPALSVIIPYHDDTCVGSFSWPFSLAAAGMYIMYK